jgi:hypothetical protein
MAVKNASTVCSNTWIEPYNRLGASMFLRRSQIRSTGFKCEQYLGN